MTQDCVAPNPVLESAHSEQGDVAPSIANIFGSQDESCSEKSVNSIDNCNDSDEEPSDDDLIPDNFTGSDCAPPLTDDGDETLSLNIVDCSSGNVGSLKIIEDVNNVSPDVDGSSLPSNHLDMMNLDNNKNDVQHENLSGERARSDNLTIMQSKICDKMLAKEIVGIVQSTESDYDISEPDTSSERESDPPNPSMSDYSPFQEVESADVPSVMVTMNNSIQIHHLIPHALYQECRPVTPIQCTDQPTRYSQKDLLVTPSPVLLRAYMELWTRNPQEETSIMIIATETVTTLSEVLPTYSGPPDSRFNKPVNAGLHGTGVKNGSYGGLIDVLPSQDYPVTALWNYRKEIMEPCLKNFVGSFGGSEGIDPFVVC